MRIILQITSAFSKIITQVGIISSISEEHAAATEEILAAIEEQNQRIIEVTQEMPAINDLSMDLRHTLNA